MADGRITITPLAPVPTPELLKRAFPAGKTEVFAKFAPALIPALERYAITTPLRLCHFLAQVTHESSDFTRLQENLNYSADGLCGTWPKRFTRETAAAYARKPEKIANFVYAGRLGNGDAASGDGWRYRGHGPIQITGKDMYAKLSREFGVDFVANPELLLEPEFGCLAAAWLWAVEKKLNPIADADDIVKVTERINGGRIGLDDRTKRLAAVKRQFGL